MDDTEKHARVYTTLSADTLFMNVPKQGPGMHTRNTRKVSAQQPVYFPTVPKMSPLPVPATVSVKAPRAAPRMSPLQKEPPSQAIDLDSVKGPVQITRTVVNVSASESGQRLTLLPPNGFVTTNNCV